MPEEKLEVICKRVYDVPETYAFPIPKGVRGGVLPEGYILEGFIAIHPVHVPNHALALAVRGINYKHWGEKKIKKILGNELYKRATGYIQPRSLTSIPEDYKRPSYSLDDFIAMFLKEVARQEGSVKNRAPVKKEGCV